MLINGLLVGGWFNICARNDHTNCALITEVLRASSSDEALSQRHVEDGGTSDCSLELLHNITMAL
jgi:hypothetical protein